MTGKQVFILTSYKNKKEIIQTLELDLEEDYPLGVIVKQIKKHYPKCIVKHTKRDD